MDQRIFGRIGREIAGLGELKQVGYEANAGRDALAEQGKSVRQQHEPADQDGGREHDNQRRKDAPDPARVKSAGEKVAGLRFP